MPADAVPVPAHLDDDAVGAASMTTPGTFASICRYHPNMRAEILVEP